MTEEVSELGFDSPGRTPAQYNATFLA